MEENWKAKMVDDISHGALKNYVRKAPIFNLPCYILLLTVLFLSTRRDPKTNIFVRFFSIPKILKLSKSRV